MQIISDITGKPPEQGKESPGSRSSRSSPDRGGWAGIYSSVEEIDDLIKIERVIHPDASRQKAL